MLTTKYLSIRRLTEEGRKLPCSRIWAACKVRGLVYVKGLKWTVNNGSSINFWKDFCLPYRPLQSIIEGPLHRDEDQLTVQQGVAQSFNGGEYNFSFEFPEQVLNLVKATPFELNQEAKDSLAWAFSRDGLFSLKSAYLLARGLNPLNLGISSMVWIWKADTHPRIQFFMWLCSHNSFPTSEILGSRGLNLNPLCMICHQENELVDHLLRRCCVAQDLWRKLKVPRDLLFTFDQPIGKWLELNCSTGVISDLLGIQWKVVFPMGIWQLWLAPNRFYFRTGVIDKLIHTKCIKESAEFFAIGTKERCNKMKR